MAELSRYEKYRRMSVDDIEETYRMGYITAFQKNTLLREKTHAELDGLLEEKGPFKAIYERSIQNVQKGWDNLKEAIVRKPTEGTVGEQIKGEAYHAGLAVWGQIQIVTAISSAIGEVTGQKVEQLALRAGASPGLARTLNLAADIGVQTIPIGTTARSFAKSVQHATGTGKYAKAAEEVKPVADKAKVLATKLISDGMQADGVKGAHATLRSSAESVGEKVGETIEAAGHTIPNPQEPVREAFLRSLSTFQSKMDRITKVQAHEETAAMASKLGLTLDDLKRIVPGTALNEKQMWAYLEAMKPQFDRSRELAIAYRDTGTPEALEAFVRHNIELQTFAPIFREAEVTAGRSVEILKNVPPMKKITDFMASWDPANMAKGDWNGAMKTYTDDWLAILDQPGAMEKLTLQTQMAGQEIWPKARELYINLLLSNPITQTRNAIGDSIAATNSVLERVAAGAFSADRQTGVHWSEGIYLAKGMMHGIRDGIKAFGKAYQEIDPSEANKFDFVPHQIGGTLGRIINFPGDTMRGMDNFFKSILTKASYYASALREGKQRGYAAETLAEHVAQRLSNPTKAMLEEGEAFALSGTFQNELGTLGKMSQVLQRGPLLLYFPFMKTPINLAKYSWNRTPGLQLISQSLYNDILAGGVKADMAIGRLTMSNLIGAFTYQLAQEGLITGSGPIDPALRPQWLATHHPYSIATGDGWVPISNFEPGTTQIGLMADYAQIMNQLDEPSVGQGAMALILSGTKQLADKTYWRTVSDLAEMASSIKNNESVSDKTRRLLDRPLITVATGGPLVNTTAKILDPISRETRSVMDDWMSKVPGYSQDLPALRDGYGDKYLPPQTVGSAWLSYAIPFQFKGYEHDPVKLEGSKLGVHLPKFPHSIGGSVKGDLSLTEPQPGDRLPVALTPQQRDQWQENYRTLLRSNELGVEKVLMTNPDYQKAPPAMKREMFEGHLSSLKEVAFGQLQLKDKELSKKILTNQAESIRPLLDQMQQLELNQSVQEGLDLIDKLTPEEQDNLFRFGDLTPEEPMQEANP